MATMTQGQVYNLARGAGLSPAAAVTATAVARAESGLNPDAVGDVGLQDAKWGPSVGLWQIRSLKEQTGTGGPRDASRLKDPAFNARSMASISGTGKNFGPWSTFNNGAYRRFQSSAGADATAAGDNPFAGATTTGTATATSTGWLASATAIALKSLALGTGVALVVVGARQTVTTPKGT